MTITSLAKPSAQDVGLVLRRRVRDHTRMVRTLRWLLPSALFAILGVLGGFMVLNAMRNAATRPREIPTQIRMVNPHFLGRDNLGRAFNLSARRATRDDHDMQQVLLDQPVMVMDRGDGQGPSTLTADSGVYREDTHILRLHGHVRLDDAKASTVATNDALVDTRAGTVSGVSAIAGSGPQGDIQAGNYSALDKGDRLILRGGVHARLNSGAGQRASGGLMP